METVAAVWLLVLFGAALILTPAQVGKPRRPYTAASASVSVAVLAWNLVCVWVLW